MRMGTSWLPASCYAACVLALGAAACGAGETEWENVFNGRDLAGWVVEGSSVRKIDGQSAPIWSVVEGELRCSGVPGTFGFLRLDRKLCDFALEAEFRPEKGSNSGIGVRTVPYRGVRQTRPSFASYEIQLQDDGAKPADAHSSGSLYRYVAPTASAMKPAGEWNTVEVRCTGPRIEVVINGQQVQDVDQSKIAEIKDKPLCGYVCLQNHGSHVAFRNLRLKTIKAGE
jgi:Domain of Unknown Function (DUF1080)